MKQIIAFIALFACTFCLTAQSTITWKGGTPGKETAWNEPKNWDNHHVPSDLDKVIIRAENNGHFSMPIINESVTVAWIEIQSGASLTVAATGELIVDGSYTYSEGITLHGGSIFSDGNIVLISIEQDFEDQFRKEELYSSSEKSEAPVNNSLQAKGW
ncbi:MAG: hypothetical protein KDC24_03415 [Saprospiraceae bacterium]|nr:hypothetical protein [Saprospiraceae bacterium]